MFKKIIFILPFLISFKVFSHSQSPISGKDTSLNGRSLAVITVTNTQKKPKSFQMYLDGIEYGSPFNLGGYNKKVFKVFLENIKPDVIEKHLICSQSIPSKGEMFASRICTKYTVVYPRKKINKFFHKEGYSTDD